MSQGTSTENATRTATADSPAAPAHTKKKRGCGGCFLILFLLVPLVVAGTGFGYWLIQNGSQRNLRDQLAAAETAGSANTLEQVQQLYAVPAGTLDTTANWNSATDVFNTDEYDRARGNLPIVTTNETPRWPPLEWRDRDAAEALVDKFRGKLIELQLAAVGPAAWPVDFADNWRLADDVINGIWRGFFLMELNCYVAAHRRNEPELVRSLAACLTWGNAFALHPAHQNQRLDLETRSLNLLLRVLEKVELTDESLVKLKSLIVNRDYWGPVRDHWQYQRAARLLMYTDVDQFRNTALGRQMQEDPEWTEFMDNLDMNMKYSPMAGDDAGQFLYCMDVVAETFNGHLLTAADSVQQLEGRVRDVVPEGLDRYRFPTARFMIPGVHELIRKSGHVNALRQVALAALAADYYRFQNKRLPGNLSEAMDGFLDDQPVDVYTGEPIIVRPQRSELLIFSCGPNGSDNGLEHDDIGIRLIQDKWSPLIGPVTEFD